MNRSRHWTAITLALAALAPLVIASCGEKVLLGGTQPAPDPTCVGAPCGATCAISVCPASAGTSCSAPAQLGFCDPETNACTPNTPTCPPPPLPCLGQPCGTACQPECKPGELDCPAAAPGEFTCDGAGSCVAGPTTCSCTDPACILVCDGLPCGAPCGACGPTDPSCPSPEELFCDGFGACVPPGTSMCPPPYEPCLGKLCGEPCTLCLPNEPGCVEPPEPLACDSFGSCVPPGTSMCPPPYEPCLGKVCGEPCTLCPPADPGCVEPPGAKLCDDFAQCLPDMIGCAEPVDGGMGP